MPKSLMEIPRSTDEGFEYKYHLEESKRFFSVARTCAVPIVESLSLSPPHGPLFYGAGSGCNLDLIYSPCIDEHVDLSHIYGCCSI